MARELTTHDPLIYAHLHIQVCSLTATVDPGPRYIASYEGRGDKGRTLRIHKLREKELEEDHYTYNYYYQLDISPVYIRPCIISYKYIVWSK